VCRTSNQLSTPTRTTAASVNTALTNAIPAQQVSFVETPRSLAPIIMGTRKVSQRRRNDGTGRKHTMTMPCIAEELVVGIGIKPKQPGGVSSPAGQHGEKAADEKISVMRSGRGWRCALCSVVQQPRIKPYSAFNINSDVLPSGDLRSQYAFLRKCWARLPALT